MLDWLIIVSAGFAGLPPVMANATGIDALAGVVCHADVCIRTMPATQHATCHGARHSFPTTSLLLDVCTYAGYFIGSVGIILLAALNMLGQTDLRGA